MKKDIDMAEKVSGVSSAPMSKLGVQIAGGEDFSHGGGRQGRLPTQTGS